MLLPRSLLQGVDECRCPDFAILDAAFQIARRTQLDIVEPFVLTHDFSERSIAECPEFGGVDEKFSQINRLASPMQRGSANGRNGGEEFGVGLPFVVLRDAGAQIGPGP